MHCKFHSRRKKPFPNVLINAKLSRDTSTLSSRDRHICHSLTLDYCLTNSSFNIDLIPVHRHSTTVIQSYSHTVILSYCHTVILSYCHTVILSYQLSEFRQRYAPWHRRRDSQAVGEHGTMGDGSGFEEEKEGRDRHVCLYYSDVPRTCDNCDPRGPCSDPTADEARQRCVGNRAREITGSTRLKNRAESKKEKIGEGPMIRVRKQGSPPALGINYRVYGKS